MLEILSNLVADTGKVTEVYGGYEVIINSAETFPWYKVCKILLEHSFEVWMVKSDSDIILMSKPAID
jgi:hypothetical protein